jgi:hypothetical protein
MTDEYREATEDARNALRRLLKMSEPGTGLLLHNAYNALGRMLDEPEKPPPSLLDFEREERERQDREQRERWARWKNTPQHDRERLILEVLGDERLKSREVAARLEEKIGGAVWYGPAYAALEKMRQAGEVDREPAEMYRGRRVWRYFRRATLEGPIADLQRQLDEDRADG